MRKVRERGWAGAESPDLERLAEHFAELGYIDDAGFALARARAMTGRGFGKRRVVQALHVAGIADEDGEAARESCRRRDDCRRATLRRAAANRAIRVRGGQ